MARAFGPDAQIANSDWIEGPDGRRDMDVFVAYEHDGRTTRLLLECKDYNPSTTGPVGIEVVDALASKMVDLRMNAAGIVSNAGFTEGALRKASRLGIATLSVMRAGDQRIRYQVTETIYSRQVRVTSWKLEVLDSSVQLANVPLDTIYVKDRLLVGWLAHRTVWFLGINPVVKGTYTARYSPSEAVELRWEGGSLVTSRLVHKVAISGAWYAHDVRFDSTTAVYDWARRRIRLAPGLGSVQIHGLDFSRGIRVSAPPERYVRARPVEPGEVDFGFIMLRGYPTDHYALPEFEALLSADDLDLRLKELTPDMYESDPTFQDDSGA